MLRARLPFQIGLYLDNRTGTPSLNTRGHGQWTRLESCQSKLARPKGEPRETRAHFFATGRYRIDNRKRRSCGANFPGKALDRHSCRGERGYPPTQRTGRRGLCNKWYCLHRAGTGPQLPFNREVSLKVQHADCASWCEKWTEVHGIPESQPRLYRSDCVQ